MDKTVLPERPDGRVWVDDPVFGLVHWSTFWHTVDGVRLRKLKGSMSFVAVWPHMPGRPDLLSPPAVAEEDLEPDEEMRRTT